jgi:hypothetical protein
VPRAAVTVIRTPAGCAGGGDCVMLFVGLVAGGVAGA